MSRNLYIHDRLTSWGRWCLYRSQSSVGARGTISSIYMGKERVQSSGDHWYQMPGLDLDAVKLDAIIARLSPELRLTLAEVYVRGAHQALGQNARTLGISRRALFSRLCRADLQIDQHLRGVFATNPSMVQTVYVRARAASNRNG